MESFVVSLATAGALKCLVVVVAVVVATGSFLGLPLRDDPLKPQTRQINLP